MILADLAATQAIGVALADGIEAQHWPACLLLFRGPLGAGKTTLIRALLGALGVTGTIRSPSYTLIEGYPLASTTVHHVDLYRLNDPSELEDLGFADLLNGRDICLIEWPERAPRLAAQADLLVDLELMGPLRHVGWHARTPLGLRLSARLPV